MNYGYKSISRGIEVLCLNLFAFSLKKHIYINTNQTLSPCVHDSVGLNIEIRKEIDWRTFDPC